MNRAHSEKRYAWAGALALAGAALALAGRADATHGTFASGDVFVSLKTGLVQWRHADGTLNRTLVSVSDGHAEGLGFDAAGNLYVAHWYSPTLLSGNTVAKFNTNGILLGTFGSGYNCNPHSIVFDGSGSAYVGQADCTHDVLKLDGLGVPQRAFNADVENRGTNWIDLAMDGCTLFYTSEGSSVKRYNVCAQMQLPDFNALPLPGGEGHALKILPDGGVLVANDDVIARLDAAGTLTQTYDVSGEPSLWWGLDLTGDGRTFWTSNFGSSNVVKLDLATGAVVASFNTGTPQHTVKGVAVKRGPSAVIQRGRMTGGGSIFTDAGMRVTHGFELHCDPSRKPNNFEVNTHPSGAQGRRFHLEKLTSASCVDDPTIEPTPPSAPFDTYHGTGEGLVDGQPGGTAEWTLTDAGEPGTNDRWSMTIRDAQGNVVVTFANKPLTKGNHQAHK